MEEWDVACTIGHSSGYAREQQGAIFEPALDDGAAGLIVALTGHKRNHGVHIFREVLVSIGDDVNLLVWHI